MPALSRGGLDGVHDLEDVVGQIAAGSVRLPVRDTAVECGSHVG
jgi:hypothetical protein